MASWSPKTYLQISCVMYATVVNNKKN